MRPRSANYLDLVPSRAVVSETESSGRTILLRPKFVWGPLARYLLPHLRNRYVRVRLDEIGTAIWEAIDGHRTVLEIADDLVRKFGDRVEPRYPRCARFIHSLDQGAMVRLSPKDPAGKEKQSRDDAGTRG